MLIKLASSEPSLGLTSLLRVSPQSLLYARAQASVLPCLSLKSASYKDTSAVGSGLVLLTHLFNTFLKSHIQVCLPFETPTMWT